MSPDEPARAPRRRPTERFHFVAASRSGETVDGDIEASSERELARRLEDRGLVVVRSETSSASTRPGNRWGGVRTRELIQFTIQLRAYAAAGIGTPNALENIAAELPAGRMRSVALGRASSVRSGEPLTEALEAYPNVFSPIYVSLVRSAEVSGRVADALAQIVSYLEWREHLAREIRRATFYPAVVLAATIAVLAVLFGWTLPRLFEQLDGVAVELPPLTRVVRAVAFGVARHAGAIVLGACLGASAWLAVGSTDRGRIALDRFLLRIPLYGRVLTELVTARFVRVFRTLSSTGVNVVLALELAARSSGNRFFEQEISVARDRILLDGASLTDALSGSSTLPGLVRRMFRAGEDTGQLELTLGAAHEYYERQVPLAVSWFLRWFELAVLLVLGGVVLAVVLSIYLLLAEVVRQASGMA